VRSGTSFLLEKYKGVNIINLYTVPEIAEMLKVRKNYVYELIYTGELKAIRLSERRFRISENALNNFICRQEENGVI